MNLNYISVLSVERVIYFAEAFDTNFLKKFWGVGEGV